MTTRSCLVNSTRGDFFVVVVDVDDASRVGGTPSLANPFWLLFVSVFSFVVGGGGGDIMLVVTWSEILEISSTPCLFSDEGSGCTLLLLAVLWSFRDDNNTSLRNC